MMTRIEKMRSAVDEAKKYLEKAPTYTMAGSEFFALYHDTKEDCAGALINSFQYGFIKGMRYQKAQERKKRKAGKA